MFFDIAVNSTTTTAAAQPVGFEIFAHLWYVWAIVAIGFFGVAFYYIRRNSGKIEVPMAQKQTAPSAKAYLKRRRGPEQAKGASEGLTSPNTPQIQPPGGSGPSSIDDAMEYFLSRALVNSAQYAVFEGLEFETKFGKIRVNKPKPEAAA